ncbi:MAG: B12-binding domain-containing radical SAM protein [Thermodesulfobacteriota bacterium]
MKVAIIYPEWPKMKNQPEFHLPPHAPVVVAGALPSDVEVAFYDENVEHIDQDEDPDLVFISVLLTCQIKRGWEIADTFRKMGKKVIFGGIGTQIHAEETMQHADSVFLGEVEGHIEQVLRDFENGELKPLYNFHLDFPDTSLIGPANRNILKKELYNYRGVQMVDLVHASRGCRFNCFPCCTPYLGGRQFRPRPLDKVVEELEGIDNNRLFIVDNSLAQDDEWVKDLFRAITPLKKKWISHPLRAKDDILSLAADAGCWYMYQAIVDTSDVIRDRIKRVKDFGIGVEGTILLGLDKHDEDYIKRMVDFLLELDLDLAEFTILTPFPHTPVRKQLLQENRVLHNDWEKYTADNVVFQPKQMSPEKLQSLYEYAWSTFYADSSIELKMAKLFMKVLEKEKADGTFQSLRPRGNRRNWPKKDKNKKENPE